MTTETEKLPSIVSSVLIPRKDKNVKEALDVFFCFDDAFCLPTGISAFSVLENNKTLPLNVHLVGVDVSDKNLDYFKQLNCSPNSEILFHSLTAKECEKITASRSTLHFPPASFIRIFLPELFPALSKMLYLDGDTLCGACGSRLEGQISRCCSGHKGKRWFICAAWQERLQFRNDAY